LVVLVLEDGLHQPGDVDGAVAVWRRHVDEAALYLQRNGESTRALDLL
jgi:hypothetical protein